MEKEQLRIRKVKENVVPMLELLVISAVIVGSIAGYVKLFSITYDVLSASELEITPPS